MNTPSDQANRYAAPQAEVEDVNDDSEIGQLAGRGERLGAAVLDGVIAVIAVWIPMLIGFGFTGFKTLIQIARGGRDAVPADIDWSSLFTGLAIGMVGLLAVLGVNIYFVVKNRQTIGKKLMGIKVVRSDGSQISIARLFWLRNVVNALPGVLPFVGNLYGLVDHLFIFGEQRRCVHDYIADTIVVKA